MQERIEKTILFAILFILFNSSSSFHCYAQEAALIIEVSSIIIESETNFTISVYDPTIQQGTPYLVNVTILFNEKYYQITPDNENSEIILETPKVSVNKTFTIEAFADDKKGNTSITVISSKSIKNNELVITPDVYSLQAYQEFSLVITDKNGQPIENVTIYTKQENGENKEAVTDENGRGMLIAPNKEKIIIIARKDGYINATETLLIQIKKDTINQFLSNPHTPIIFALIVLIVVILYVTLSNKYLKKRGYYKQHYQKGKSKKFNNYKKTYGLRKERLSKKQNEASLNKEVTVNYYSPSSLENKTQNLKEVYQKKESTFPWFHPQKNHINKKHDSYQGHDDKSYKEIDEIHRKIDTMIIKKDNKKT